MAIAKTVSRTLCRFVANVDHMWVGSSVAGAMSGSCRQVSSSLHVRGFGASFVLYIFELAAIFRSLGM